MRGITRLLAALTLVLACRRPNPAFDLAQADGQSPPSDLSDARRIDARTGEAGKSPAPDGKVGLAVTCPVDSDLLACFRFEGSAVDEVAKSGGSISASSIPIRPVSMVWRSITEQPAACGSTTGRWTSPS